DFHMTIRLIFDHLRWSCGKWTYLSLAHHTMSKNADIKVTHSYSSNFNKLVSMQDFKFVGFKSHNCHESHRPQKLNELENEVAIILCKLEMYIVEEAIEFCLHYMSVAKSIRVPKSQHEGRCASKST
ncbi:hypothetical protein CR513_33143, partial [Mucuna pruriens]